EVRAVIKQFNPAVYKFNDETFGFNAGRANRILDSIIEEGLTATPKYASMRADRVDPQILQKMKRAGFTYIDYGVESGNPEILKAVKKGVTLEQTGKAVAMTKKAGIKVGVNVIVGHPDETRETAGQTIDYAVKLNADLTAIGIMVPYPGTEVAELAKQGKGGYKILSTDWRDFNKQVGNALELKGLSRRDMEAIQALGYLKIYAYNFRIKELFNFIRMYRKAGWRFLKKYFAIE
ncbi:MAG TPA: radical SAM protein, partial [Nitrospirae bacterium]|nr:radical SAM protein [Nitrospirota bacterium]